MGILDTLDKLKGKVLDAANFELLKSAYELQEQNISQLKSNNEALKDSNDLLKERVNASEKETHDLQNRVETIQRQLKELEPDLSAVANLILEELVKSDRDELNDELMASFIDRSRLEVKAAIAELREAGILQHSGVGIPGRGIDYFLSSQGKQYVVNAGIGKQ